VYRGKTDRRANANGSTSGERVKHSLIRSRGEENALHAEMPEKRGYDTRTTATMCPEKTATMKMFEGEIESSSGDDVRARERAGTGAVKNEKRRWEGEDEGKEVGASIHALLLAFKSPVERTAYLRRG